MERGRGGGVKGSEGKTSKRGRKVNNLNGINHNSIII